MEFPKEKSELLRLFCMEIEDMSAFSANAHDHLRAHRKRLS